MNIPTRGESHPLSSSGRRLLTDFMLSRMVRDLHSIQLQALVAFANVVNSGDIGAHFVYNLHQLKKINERF